MGRGDNQSGIFKVRTKVAWGGGWRGSLRYKETPRYTNEHELTCPMQFISKACEAPSATQTKYINQYMLKGKKKNIYICMYVCARGRQPLWELMFAHTTTGKDL